MLKPMALFIRFALLLASRQLYSGTMFILLRPSRLKHVHGMSYSVDTTVREHACVYSMARNLYWNIQEAYGAGPDLPQLHIKDMKVETIVLGSEMVGQRNKQLSWIWGFSHMVNDQGTWMEDCKVSCKGSRSIYSHMTYGSGKGSLAPCKAQFERWVEEQDSIHNEAKWIPAYFLSKSESWRKLMTYSLQCSLKGHASYASYQMHAWKDFPEVQLRCFLP